MGKSSLVLRFVKGQFHEYQESTIGAAFLTQTVCLDDTTVKFEIWDTAGQERYHSLAPMYYRLVISLFCRMETFCNRLLSVFRGAQAAIVVYDITNPDTFERAKSWVKELQRQARADIVIALAGNKSDLANRRCDHSNTFRKFQSNLRETRWVKNQICFEVKSMTPRHRENSIYSLPFLPATPLSPSQTLEGFFLS